jgi:hypothetical protein
MRRVYKWDAMVGSYRKFWADTETGCNIFARRIKNTCLQIIVSATDDSLRKRLGYDAIWLERQAPASLPLFSLLKSLEMEAVVILNLRN